MATREHGLYRRLDQPAEDAAQGGCYSCHACGPCVDTGILVYNEGTLTICLGCLQEMAEVGGFSVDAEALQHEKDISFLQNEVQELTGQVSYLNGVIDDFTAVATRRVAR